MHEKRNPTKHYRLESDAASSSSSIFSSPHLPPLRHPLTSSVLFFHLIRKLRDGAGLKGVERGGTRETKERIGTEEGRDLNKVFFFFFVAVAFVAQQRDPSL